MNFEPVTNSGNRTVDALFFLILFYSNVLILYLVISFKFINYYICKNFLKNESFYMRTNQVIFP